MLTKLGLLCRTCLAPDKVLISIYDKNELDYDNLICVADIIGNLTNTMPNKSDGLPDQVCIPCSNEIKKIHFFKIKCIDSECTLRKILYKNDEDEKVMFHNDDIKIPEHPDETILCRDENILGTSIKSEEPSCSFYITHLDSEENQENYMIKQTDIQTSRVEIIVKEEPDLISSSGQSFKNEIEAEEEDTNAAEEKQILNLESKFDERCNQNYDSDSELELLEEENTSENGENELISLGAPQKTDKQNQLRLKCPHCNKLFMHLSRLKRHIRNHSQNPIGQKLLFTCTICKKSYNHQFSLKRHNLVSHKRELTKEIIKESIEICKELKTDENKEVENETSIEPVQPTNEDLNSIEAMRQCSHCKDVFENDEALALHKKTHTIEKIHICNICNKGFGYKHNLKIHLMSHKKIKPFKCEECDQRFVRNSCLNRHLKTHTGDRPYTCEFCSKGFPYMYALKIHLRSHTEERPYSCTICSMRFKFPNTLKEHQRTHTGEKPYACKLCPRRLSSKNNFRIHMKTHEKEIGNSTQESITEETIVKSEC